LAATIKARWICEQAHQQMKEELGLDHFEGRSWQGLHRHALMTMIAYAFLQHRRLATPAAAIKPSAGTGAPAAVDAKITRLKIIPRVSNSIQTRFPFLVLSAVFAPQHGERK
jgi:hypothetical protein